MFFKQQTQTPSTFFQHRHVAIACCGLILLLTMMLAACGGTTTTGSGTPTPTAKGKISVLYAGSLVNLMEKKISPAFTSGNRLSF